MNRIFILCVPSTLGFHRKEKQTKESKRELSSPQLKVILGDENHCVASNYTDDGERKLNSTVRRPLLRRWKNSRLSRYGWILFDGGYLKPFTSRIYLSFLFSRKRNQFAYNLLTEFLT